MRFLHVKLNTLPVIRYAHGYKTSDYHMSFTPKKNMMEICLYEVGGATKSYPDGRVLEIPVQTLCAVSHDEEFHMDCREPVHQHFTVGFESEYTYETVEASDLHLSYFGEKSDGIPLEFYLPEMIGIESGESASEQILRKVIRTYTENGGHSDIVCITLLFDLFAQLNADCIASSASADFDREKPFSSSLYVRRATQYIASHIGGKITVSEIADTLGISAEHLSKQFHSVTGTTVIEYINRLKLGVVKELIVSKGISLREAGESVGITDVNYLSRLFKRYIGITASEYKILHKTYCLEDIKKSDTTIASNLQKDK